MAMEDMTDSCVTANSSPPNGSKTQAQARQQYKLDVYNEVLLRLKEAAVKEALSTTFDDELWNHFNRLPARYAMDVNAERAENVLTHKKMLELARDPEKRPIIFVRLVQVTAPLDEIQSDFSDRIESGEEDSNSKGSYFSRQRSQSVHPPPAFGSTTNLEALALEANRSVHNGSDAAKAFPRPMHEITFATIDVPKLLNTLTSMLSDLGLNIQEALAFSTNDGYSLDVFVVNGWHDEEVERLQASLEHEIQMLGNQAWSKTETWSPLMGIEQSDEEAQPIHVKIPTDGTDEWEIDTRLLNFGNKVASGSYGDLYRGSYCSQNVAIKVLKPERVNVDMKREFAQEIYIMRKIRHKNVLQFIGACTKLPSLFIVTEFMSGGSLYDYLHKRKNSFKLPALLRVALDISKGMNYLHQNKIIHRDLKTANLLMDENEVVKVADFGVARVKPDSGVMTAETGTYRWMAPEVIEHKPYDHKADIFSFGVVLWELITGKLPYEYLTPLQAAVGVVQKELRPTIPKSTNPKLAALIEKCWQQDPALRPDFSEIIEILQKIEVEDSERKDKPSGGFFSAFRRGH